ncbi:hypothetical protein [Salinirubrum litoreum]|uniref:Uncharacterized protein n=1 Tax=Salinirubrum litoreum TaxID=1126234 RepID=A0ABD5RFB3_9EURY|nr:hypothetical protein [Salinirubrum litoreum]
MFSDPVNAVDPTHRLVTRNLSGVKDWDEAGGVTVENQAIAILLEYGTTVHLCLDPKHSQFKTVQNKFTRVPELERTIIGSDQEYLVSIPENRALVESLLAISACETDEWVDRTFYLTEFAILNGRSWVYRSVPHETHIREINATEHDGVIQKLNEALEQVRGSAVVPFDGLVSWTAEAKDYKLDWNALYRHTGKDAYVGYDLERLQHVVVQFSENSLHLDWRSTSEESLVRRTIWRVLDSEATTPPDQIGLPRGEQEKKVVSALHWLRANLNYSYDIEE